MSVTVVIPAFNSAHFIAETLQSVLRQTLPADEILVIDDGSTDNTAAVAEAFGPPVRVIRRQNARQAASRNFGVQEATSEWIAFIDADDLWEPNKLERQMEELARNPAADLCYTARIHMEKHGDEVRFGPLIAVPEAGNIRKALYRNTVFLPSSVVLRRSTFLASGGFDTRFRIIEDWDLWLRLLHAGIAFAACREPLLLYRVHPGSVSHNALLSLQEKNEIFRNRVVPRLPIHTRWFRHNRVRSEHEYSAAFGLRSVGDPACLSMMARSIARDPFYGPKRYKVLAHMIYKRLLS